MDKIDARKHSPETQYEVRKQVVRLRKQGLSNKVVAQGVGISECHASTIWQRYQREGSSAIKLGQRGRRHGEQRSLLPEQERQVQRILIGKTPDRSKLAFTLWTRDAVQLLIKDQFGIRMPIRTIGEYLKRWGFTPQKPIKRAYEQNPQAVKKWFDSIYPAIVSRAKQEKTEIHWGEETSVLTGINPVKSLTPNGKTPAGSLSSKKSSINMISAIANQGKIRFMISRKAITDAVLIKFMAHLTKDAERKVFLILNTLGSHHSKKVISWLEEHTEKIEVFHIPSYPLKLNPDEYLIGNPKTKVHYDIATRKEDKIEPKIRSSRKSLSKRPQHVRSCFNHPEVQYAE